MDIKKTSIKNSQSRIFEFFYTLIHVFSAPRYFFLIFWAFQWLLIISPLLLGIFSKARNGTIESFCQSFNIWTYIPDQFYFKIFTYCIFGLTQVFISFGNYILYKCGNAGSSSNEKTSESKSQFSILFSLSHVFLMLCSTILLQIETNLLVFTIRSLSMSDKFCSYKNIKFDSFDSSTITYLMLTLNSITFIELIILYVINILLCQDRSILKKFFWTSNMTYCDFMMLIMQIITHFYFVMVYDVFFFIKEIKIANNFNRLMIF